MFFNQRNADKEFCVVQADQLAEPFEQLYPENQAEICGLEEEMDEEVAFENGGDVDFME